MASLYVEIVSGQRLQHVKIQLKIKVPFHKNECPPTILIHTQPFIVSTNVLMIYLFNNTFLCPFHDMTITLEMIITGYSEVF